MYFLLEKVDFQPAMLVYREGKTWISPGHMSFAAVVQLCSDFSLARHLKIREIGSGTWSVGFFVFQKRFYRKKNMKHDTGNQFTIYTTSTT